MRIFILGHGSRKARNSYSTDVAFRRIKHAQTLEGGRFVVEVVVRDNNVDQALRALKKKMQREGIFREMKMRRHFEKPSEERVRRAAEAVRRTRKLARKNADKND